jgi:hypothetical protein
VRRSHLPAESVLAVDDLKLDRVERRVERAGRRIDLTSKEFCLLEYLMRKAGALPGPFSSNMSGIYRSTPAPTWWTFMSTICAAKRMTGEASN